MNPLRTRCMIAMGLLGCAENDARAPSATATVEVPPPAATAAVSATATATASASVTAEPIATSAPPPPPPPPPAVRGLSNVPNFQAEYPHQNHRGCSTAYAHCYMLRDLQKLASVGASCPASEDVPQGCMGGTPCADPDARTNGPLLANVSRQQTAAKGAAACCYEVPDLCCAACGRTLRDGERVVVTPSTRREDWIHAFDDESARDATRAARFEAMAAAEHASIASFARTSLELLALGAPAELLRDTHRAALDEIDHARIAYELASAAAGEPRGPAALVVPPNTQTTFASFTRSTFVDACVGESLGASELRELAARESDERVRRVLDRIAEDEERHVELAFRTLAWTVRAGGDEARGALAHALRDLDPAIHARRVVRDVVVPCARALLDQRART